MTRLSLLFLTQNPMELKSAFTIPLHALPMGMLFLSESEGMVTGPPTAADPSLGNLLHRHC
jgi:hypothetical protein